MLQTDFSALQEKVARSVTHSPSSLSLEAELDCSMLVHISLLTLSQSPGVPPIRCVFVVVCAPSSSSSQLALDLELVFCCRVGKGRPTTLCFSSPSLPTRVCSGPRPPNQTPPSDNSFVVGDPTAANGIG